MKQALRGYLTRVVQEDLYKEKTGWGERALKTSGVTFLASSMETE